MRYEDLEDLGVNLILSNTYHLYLRPGREVIAAARGLHSFMGWPHNILTDSGGYQIFSLSSFRTVEDEGVAFRSHIDGSSHRLTPERCHRHPGRTRQRRDDAPGRVHRAGHRPGRMRSPGGAQDHRVAAGERRPLACEARDRSPASSSASCRETSTRTCARRAPGKSPRLDLPGYAIGGLSVGEDFSQFQEFLHFSAALLPAGKPKYLMGIGTPAYILEAVEAGIDLFDCVYPTRTARNAQVLTRDGPLSLRNERFRQDNGPIDPECRCSTCSRHTRSYLRHLFKAQEIQAAVLATCHNLAFIQELVSRHPRRHLAWHFCGVQTDLPFALRCWRTMTAMPKWKEGPFTMSPRLHLAVFLLLSAALLPAQALKVSYVPAPAPRTPPAAAAAATSAAVPASVPARVIRASLSYLGVPYVHGG